MLTLSANLMILKSDFVTKYYTDIVKLYSRAFFELAVSNNNFENISKEVTNLQKVLSQDSSILEVISAPIYSDQEQIELVNKIIKNLDLSEMIANTLMLLAQNKRLELLLDILNYFEVILSENSGYKIAEVTVSYELSATEKNNIQKRLEKELDSKVQLSLRIDPQILGGIIIKVDNKMLDASLKKKFIYLNDNVQNQIAFL